MTTARTYSISRDGIADLALPVELDERLTAALHGDDATRICEAIEDQVNAQIAQHGVTADGEWLGDWSAEDIVRDVLSDSRP